MLTLLLIQTLYTDHGNPTADEQRVLWLINRARAAPFAEGARLGINPDITENLTAAQAARTIPQPPLAMNAKLQNAARAYAQLMWDSDQFAHTVGGTNPDDRMEAAGYLNIINWAENLATGDGAPYDSAEELEDDLMRDFSVASRGHRTNLLDIYDVDGIDPRREVGIGYLVAPSNKTNIFRHILVQDFASSSAGTPFLVGTVYLDANNNNEFDAGEGLGGVEIRLSSGSFYAVTGGAGGYAFPTASSGTVDVTASGDNLPADVVFLGETLTSDNRLLDFRVAPQTDTDVDGLPDFWETRFGGGLMPLADDDGDTFSNMDEFKGGSDPKSAASTPTPAPGVPPPSPGGGGSSGGGGGCGLTGLEAVLAALLLRGRRRV